MFIFFSVSGVDSFRAMNYPDGFPLEELSLFGVDCCYSVGSSLFTRVSII